MPARQSFAGSVLLSQYGATGKGTPARLSGIFPLLQQE